MTQEQKVQELLKPSVEWYAEIKSFFTILDADGWDRKNFTHSFYEEPISKDEFVRRVCNSTVNGSIDKLSEHLHFLT